MRARVASTGVHVTLSTFDAACETLARAVDIEDDDDEGRATLVSAAMQDALSDCTDAQAAALVTAITNASEFMGRGLLTWFTGDGDPSVWGESFEVVSSLFPGTDCMPRPFSAKYTAGAKAFAFVYDRVVSALLAALWQWTDPALKFAVPPPTDVAHAAARVAAAAADLAPSTVLRSVAGWDFPESGCDVMRAAAGGSHFLNPMGEESDHLYGQIVEYLLSVRYMRMAVRRAKAVTEAMVFWLVDRCAVQESVTQVLSSNEWQYGKWAALFASASSKGGHVSVTVASAPAALRAHPCTLPKLLSAGRATACFPMMYLMRYRVMTAELAWIRRSAAIQRYRGSKHGL